MPRDIPKATIHLTSRKYVTALYAVAAGWVMRSFDGGHNWQTLPIVGATGAAGIAMSTPMTGVAIGNDGDLYYTDDSGDSWTSVLAGSYHAASFGDASIGWAIGSSAAMQKTVDGGRTWAAVTLPDIGGVNLNAVSACSPQIAYACGNVDAGSGVILKTTDGVTWTRQTTGVGASSLYGIAAGRVLPSSDQSDIAMTSGATQSLYTNDGGTTWAAITGAPAPGFYQATVLNSRLAIFPHGGSLWRSVDGGANMSEIAGSPAVCNGIDRLSDTRAVVLSWDSSGAEFCRVYEISNAGATIQEIASWQSGAAGNLVAVQGYIQQGPALTLEVA